MERVHCVDEKPFEDVQHVAVAIRGLAGAQRHLGMLHRDGDSDSVLMLHLAWHHDLKNEPPKPSYLWVDPAVHPRRLTQVAAICRHIWRANQKGGIPYGFSPPNDCFDAETGRYLLGPTQHGLTCATFVLAVFHIAGLQLVQYDTWPVSRDGDAEWQQRIVTLLQQHGAPAKHIEAVSSELGSIRYRPEEVAGAATMSALPADFHTAAERGQRILDRPRNN
jgi:hypothetical protein